MELLRFCEEHSDVFVKVQPGQSVLEAALASGVRHYNICGGHARCSTCRVRVLAHPECLSPRSVLEEMMAAQLNWGDEIRLACQARVTGSAVVERLVLDDIEADLVSRLGANRKTSGREQSVAIMFMDLKGFTTLSEKALAYDVVHLLNSYYREVGDAILHNRGWIDKYIGDGIMALFGLQGGNPEDFCLAAARAALEGIARVRMLNQVTKKQFGVELSLRVGIHYGVAVVGEMGHPMHMQQTAIGDAVNIAQRLESTAKDVGADLLVSSDLLEQSNGELLTGQRGLRQLKGRGEPTEFVEVIGLARPDAVFLVQTSFVHLRPYMARFVEKFYARLLKESPELAPLFEDADAVRLNAMVAKMFGTMIAGDKADQAEEDLTDLSLRHKNYGATPDFLPLIGRAFLATIREALPENTNPLTLEAWEQRYVNTTALMMKGLQ
jgi:class 3 adenylate cyclase/hemoglobin-like flavoprotein